MEQGTPAPTVEYCMVEEFTKTLESPSGILPAPPRPTASIAKSLYFEGRKATRGYRATLQNSDEENQYWERRRCAQGDKLNRQAIHLAEQRIINAQLADKMQVPLHATLKGDIELLFGRDFWVNQLYVTGTDAQWLPYLYPARLLEYTQALAAANAAAPPPPAQSPGTGSGILPPPPDPPWTDKPPGLPLPSTSQVQQGGAPGNEFGGPDQVGREQPNVSQDTEASATRSISGGSLPMDVETLPHSPTRQSMKDDHTHYASRVDTKDNPPPQFPKLQLGTVPPAPSPSKTVATSVESQQKGVGTNQSGPDDRRVGAVSAMGYKWAPPGKSKKAGTSKEAPADKRTRDPDTSRSDFPSLEDLRVQESSRGSRDRTSSRSSHQGTTHRASHRSRSRESRQRQTHRSPSRSSRVSTHRSSSRTGEKDAHRKEKGEEKEKESHRKEKSDEKEKDTVPRGKGEKRQSVKDKDEPPGARSGQKQTRQEGPSTSRQGSSSAHRQRESTSARTTAPKEDSRQVVLKDNPAKASCSSQPKGQGSSSARDTKARDNKKTPGGWDSSGSDETPQPPALPVCESGCQSRWSPEFRNSGGSHKPQQSRQ